MAQVLMTKWRSAGAFLVATAILAACGAGQAGSTGGTSPSPSVARVRLSANAIVPNSVYVWLTQDQGIFAKHGVAVDLQGFNAGQTAVNSLVAGELDGAVYPGPQALLNAQATGSDLKVVATVQTVYDFLLVVPGDVTSPEQLKGKKMGSSTTSAISTEAPERLLRKYGLEVGKDYQFVSTGTTGGQSTTVASLIAHQVDFAALAPDFASKAVAQGGFHSILDFAKTDLPVSGQSLVFHASYVQQHPDVVQKVVDSLIDGARFVREHNAETEALLKSRYQLDDQAQLDATYSRELDLITKDPLPTKEQFLEVVGFMPKDAPKVSEEMVTSMIEPRFVQDAEKRGLTNY